MVLQTKPPKRGLNNIPDEILLQILKRTPSFTSLGLCSSYWG